MIRSNDCCVLVKKTSLLKFECQNSRPLNDTGINEIHYQNTKMKWNVLFSSVVWSSGTILPLGALLRVQCGRGPGFKRVNTPARPGQNFT